MKGVEVTTEEELHLAPESIEAVAQRVAELVGGVVDGGGKRRERITAEEVSRWWGVGRRWVYDHADELGAQRLGSGRRPRLRFDPDEVAERLGTPDHPRRGDPDMQGLRPIAGDCGAGSLSTSSRATVAGRHKRRPGRAV
jgi:hypothetical protein